MIQKRYNSIQNVIFNNNFLLFINIFIIKILDYNNFILRKFIVYKNSKNKKNFCVNMSFSRFFPDSKN